MTMVTIPTKLESLPGFVGFKSDTEMFGALAPWERVGAGSVPAGLKQGQWKFEFPAHGVSVSVIRHRGSYGRQQGLFEMACLGPSGAVFNDVEGHLSEDEVVTRLTLIGALGVKALDEDEDEE